MTNKFLSWQGVLRDKLQQFKQRYLNDIPTVYDTYGTDTGRLRDDKTRNMSGARVAHEWLKYAAAFMLIFTLGLGNVWGYTGTFTNYTNSTLIDGYYIICPSTSASNKNYCAGTDVSSSRITGKALTSKTNPANAYVWIIENTASGWTFNNYGTSTKYIRQKGKSSGGGMEVNTTIGYFTLDGYNSSSPVGYKFTSADQNSNNQLKWNNSSKWFANYANAYTTSMTPVCLYRDNTKYRAKTTQPATGSFTASATSATWDGTKKHLSWMSSGATVTLTATPPSGKAVNAWTVTKATGGTVTVTSTGANTATFSMPADQVTVTVTWKDAAASCSTIPTVSAGSNSAVTSTTATVSCASGITSLGSAGCSISSYGFVIGSSSNPAIGGTGVTKHEVGTSYTTTGTSFSKNLTGLSASTTYYVRPYATNGKGTAYGTQTSFTTSAACTTSPTVTAGSTGTVTSATAVVNCSSGISSLGTGGCAITSYGFVYGTSENPTISDTKIEVGTSYASTGAAFNASLTGLTEGQLYYVRPYATNGYGTGYGTQTSFGTPKIESTQSTRNFGDKKVNGGPYKLTFKVSGTYLQSDISITKSGTNQAMFSIDETTVTQTDGTAAQTTITVSYSPTAAGSHTATLTLTSTNATNKTVSLSGTGKWEVTWDVSGSTPTTTLVANNEKPTLPDPSGITSCDATSTTFIGWTKTPWVGKQNQAYIDGLTGDNVVHTANTTMSNVNGNGTTYYAVWAKRSAGSSGSFTITASDITTGPASYSFTETKFTKLATNDIGYKNISYNNSNTPTNWAVRQRMQFKRDATNFGELYNLVAVDGLTKIRIYDHSNSSNLTIYTGATSKATTTTLSWPSSATGTESLRIPKSTSGTLSFTSSYYDFTVSNNHTFFYIKNGNSAVAYPIKIVVYYSTYTYSDYLTSCCNMPTLAFGASSYAILREDLGGASNKDTNWATVDVTFTSNNTTGTISATTYTDGKTVYRLSSWQSRDITGGTLCVIPTATANSGEAWFEVLTQPSGETPGTGRFHVKTTSGQTGQGTYRIAITQASTDESHGNFCEKTVYGFVDVTLRDKFVDVVNGNGTVNKDGRGAQVATPLLSELGTQVENACHSEGRKLKGWIKETDLTSNYGGSTTRMQTLDGKCQTCDDSSDITNKIVAPGTNTTMSGVTWYAVWAYER